MAKIKAFGKEVTREEAYQIIVNDWICYICYARNTEGLRILLLDGWTSLRDWTDKELEDFIDTLCESNQASSKVSAPSQLLH